jgi:biotin carboxyl carrier protein
MEFKIEDLAEVLTGEIIQTSSNGEVIVKINGKEYILRLLKLSTYEFEFILDHTFHHAKIIKSSTAEIQVLIDGQLITVKKHSKLTEVLEKSLSHIRSKEGAGGENSLSSQIPGRVVNILANKGDVVKKGDSIIILESMKMQVAIKSHRDGYIKEVKVKQGTTVARNDVVAIIG